MIRAPGPRWIAQRRGLVLALLLAAPAACAGAGNAIAGAPSAAQPDPGVAAYRQHLEKLQSVVAECRRQRTPDACNPGLVGADDQAQFRSGGSTVTRTIRYDWLRETLDRAGKKDTPQKPPALPIPGVTATPVPIDTQLAQAQQRLEADWKQAGGSAPAAATHAAERRSIAAILARREYRGVGATSPWQRLLEWLENLLANFFGHLIGFGARSPWIAFALRALLIGSLLVALVWALIRIERRSRVRLVPDAQPAPGAPSARGWQLWLQDAERMAAQGLWREAIHFVYWAAIARLESRRAWPADRARTPREYLRVFPAADPRHEDLSVLTRSFEKTWYGGRDARAADFEAAMRMAAKLGVE